MDINPNLNSVIDMLMDISNHLSANEYSVGKLRSDKVADDASWIQSPSLSLATPRHQQKAHQKKAHLQKKALVEPSKQSLSPWQTYLTCEGQGHKQDEECLCPGLGYL